MPIPAIALIAGAAAVPQLVKIGAGIGYGIKSKKYAKAQRPAYEIPQAYKDYLAQTKFRAGTFGLAGQGAIESKLARQSATSARAIERSGQSAASKIAGIAALDQASKEQVSELGVQAARQNERELQDFYQAQRLMGSEQMRQWEWDKRGPYENAMATAARLQEASQEAIFGGLEGLSDIALSGMELYANKDKEKSDSDKKDNDKKDGDKKDGDKGSYRKYTPNSMPWSGEINQNPTAQIQLPNQITNGFNSQFYGMPITNEMSDYYNMNNNFNRLFNSLFV